MIPLGGSVQNAVYCEPFEGHHRSPRGAKRRNEATVNRFAVQPDRARAAVACIATFSYIRPTMFPSERPQALARPRIGLEVISMIVI